jgi:glycosyltransferase involved in cell wall biosynthesis
MHRYESRFAEVSAHGEYLKRERHFTRLCRWARGVLVDSEVGKKHVIDSYGLNPVRIHVLPYIAPKYPDLSCDKTGDIRDLDLPQKYLFYPAQFWGHKNHKALVQAAALLKPRIPDLKIVFAGSEKNGLAETREKVHALKLSDSIHFLGYVPNDHIPILYRRARALIMPTFFGPTNIPPLEAAAFGCPVAVSDIYGMRQQMGDAALYFDPSSVGEIADVMERLWKDDPLCINLIHCGKALLDRWNQGPFNERFLEIIERVIGRVSLDKTII